MHIQTLAGQLLAHSRQDQRTWKRNLAKERDFIDLTLKDWIRRDTRKPQETIHSASFVIFQAPGDCTHFTNLIGLYLDSISSVNASQGTWDEMGWFMIQKLHHRNRIELGCIKIWGLRKTHEKDWKGMKRMEDFDFFWLDPTSSYDALLSLKYTNITKCNNKNPAATNSLSCRKGTI